ncbi:MULTISPECIES: alpha/beta hydrolase [unclassified Pseudoxanthomonas]|uniref:alpha/beta hydrolase n=1 Tax=unclassified Pseudoxanthomonas TaxID=2645906 RepID=UPI00307D796B
MHKLHGFLIMTVLLLNPGVSSAAIRYDEERPLTSLHGPSKQNPMSQLDAVLDGLLVDSAEGPRTIVLYVHGRGNEPKKSFQDTMFTSGFVLKKLERQNVSVLGYNWKSKIKPMRLCDRPVAEARSGAKGLRRLIADLDRHKRANDPRWKGRRVVLLAHSMGGIVVAEAMQDPATSQVAKDLFDIIIVSASDEPVQGHVAWQERMPEGKVYVLSNPGDRFLRRSMACEKGGAATRLGLISASETSVPRSATTTYIEVPAGNRHRYISRGAQEGNPNTCAVVTTLLRGNQPTLAATWRIGGGPARFSIPAGKDPRDRCFVGAEDESGDDKDS